MSFRSAFPALSFWVPSAAVMETMSFLTSSFGFSTGLSVLSPGFSPSGSSGFAGVPTAALLIVLPLSASCTT